MQITFNGEAGETYQKLVSFLATYTVQVEVGEGVLDADEVFDATFIGPDHDSEWYDAVLVRRYDENEQEGEIESVRARSIHVY